MICSRLKTAVGRPRKAFRMPNSMAVSRSGCPAKAAMCWAESIDSAPCANGACAGLASASRGATRDRGDARDQLARAERFCHVVVAADLEPEHAVDLLVPRGQKQDRHVGG